MSMSYLKIGFKMVDPLGNTTNQFIDELSSWSQYIQQENLDIEKILSDSKRKNNPSPSP